MRRLAPVLGLLLCLFVAGPASAGEVGPRVVHGDDAPDGHFPWTVSLIPAGGTSRGTDHFCGGTLISSTTVLTATHCTVGAAPDDIEAVIGVTNLTSATRPANYYGVDAISQHPQAFVDPDDPYEIPRYDLSVLTLSRAVTGITPMPIGQPADVTGRFEVSGWGITDFSADPVDALQHAAVDHIPDTDASCFGAEQADMLCALEPGNDGAIADSCNGDSGGPLAKALPGAVATDAANWRLVGAVSFGPADCGTAGAPGVYADVTHADLRAYATGAVAGEDAIHPLTGGVTIDGGGGRVGDTIACAQDITWSRSGAELLEELLVRKVAGGDLQTLSTTGTYVAQSSDVGGAVFCEARASVAGASPKYAGGYGIASNAIADDVTIEALPVIEPVEEQPLPEPQPAAPVEQPPVVQPPVVIPSPIVQPRLIDTARPTTRSVSRKCRKRVCTFTIRTRDAQPSAGVKTVQATLTSITRSRCGKRRRMCTRVRTRTLRTKRVDATTFTVKTVKLRRGSYSLRVTAVDGAGNLQRTTTRRRFSIRR